MDDFIRLKFINFPILDLPILTIISPDFNINRDKLTTIIITTIEKIEL